MNSRERGWAVVGAASALLALGACEGALERGRDVVVERHRAEGRGRVGVLRGMEVGDQAVAVARRMARRSAPACHPVPAGPFVAELKWSAEVSAGNEVRARLIERRRIVRSADSGVRVLYTSTFRDVTGREDTLEREEIVIGDARWVREHNLPFTTRRAHPGDAQATLERGMDPIGALLSAAGPRWFNDGAPDTWRAEPGTDGLSMRCVAQGEAPGWLESVLTLGQLVEATASLPAPNGAGPRQRRATLVLLNGDKGKQRIHIEVDESTDYQATEPVLPPGDVAPTQRDRPYEDAREILGKRLGLEDWR